MAEQATEADNEDAEPTQLRHDPNKRWGTSPSGRPLFERDLLPVFNGTWAPHVVDTWLTWWTLDHPGVSLGTWVAPIGTLER